MPRLVLVVLALLALDPPGLRRTRSRQFNALADRRRHGPRDRVGRRDRHGPSRRSWRSPARRTATVSRPPRSGVGWPLPSPPQDQPAIVGFGGFQHRASWRIPTTSRPTTARASSSATRGEILTTFHVVKGASKLVVRAYGGKVFDAEIIAADPRSDLAVIVPRDDPRRRRRPSLKPITLGDGTKVRKGMFLVALGNPFNAGRDGKASASWGILANLARRIDSSQVEPTVRQLRHYPTMLQLDAKLNLGMAGGAVINLKGEMVGLTTNAANVGGFDSQAGYALPIDTLTRRAIEALKQGREVEYGFLGVKLLHQRPTRT